MKKIIRYKAIEHGIVTDAPFIGMRLCAIGCSHNCPDCINHFLLDPKIEIMQAEAKDIIQQLLDNKLNQGLILGGLEWTEQPREMLDIISEALNNNLPVILYTHHTIDEICSMFPELIGKKMFVKCGEYRKNTPGYFDAEHDVLLASGNQCIYNLETINKFRK